eukprot:750670-Pyramimonas_sp.AAC.1
MHVDSRARRLIHNRTQALSVSRTQTYRLRSRCAPRHACRHAPHTVRGPIRSAGEDEIHNC